MSGPLIIIRNKSVAGLEHLYRLVLKSIYDKSNMTPAEERLMQDSFINWAKKIGIKHWEQVRLEELAWFTYQDSKGKFDERKALFKRTGVDYKKFYRLPEAYYVGN